MNMVAKAEKVIYSLKDKFLSLEKEKRIRGRQLFTRVFIPTILMFLCVLLIISPILDSVIGISYLLYLPIITILIDSCIKLCLVPKLIIKRCHDFNNDGIAIRNIFLGIFIIYFIIKLLLAWYMLIDLSFLDSVLNILFILNNILKIWLVILWLYLLFKSWNKWKNNYWDDTSNVKIGLMW